MKNFGPLLIFLLLSDIFFPQIIIFGIGLTLSLLASPLVMFFYIAHRKLNFAPWWALSIVLLLGLMVFVSSLFSYTFLGVPFHSGDIIESVKYLKFVPYLLALSVVKYELYFDSFIRIINISSIYIIFVGLLQVYNPAGVGLLLANIYADANQAAGVVADVSRIVLTGSDPNVAAVIAFFYLITHLFFYKKNRKTFHIAAAVSFVMLFLFTQSRTALLACVFSVFAYTLFFSNVKMVIKFLILVIMVGVVEVILKILEGGAFEYLSVGFALLAIGENNSVNVRIENIEQAINLFGQSPVFGWGPAKAIHPTVIDSEYALIIGRYGLLGVVLFGSYSILIILKSKYIMRESRVLEHSPMPAIAIVFILFCLVVMLANNIYSGYQLFSILIVLAVSLRSLEVNLNSK